MHGKQRTVTGFSFEELKHRFKEAEKETKPFIENRPSDMYYDADGNPIGRLSDIQFQAQNHQNSISVPEPTFMNKFGKLTGRIFE